jgi:Xaa-Pro aminopeptidase
MAADDLDALLAISPENFAYVTGFVVPSQPVLRWRHAAALTTRDGKTALLSVDMEATTVRSKASGVEVRVWQEFEGNAMQVLADLLRDLGLADARIGIESDYLPFGDMAILRDLLPRARWIRAEHLFNRLRMIKTPRELDVLRHLSRLTDRALETALRSVRAGSTEMDLAGALTGAIYRLGADGFRFLICATGERSQYPNVGPTGRTLQEGDLVRLEIFGMLGGYHAGVCRTAAVGEPSPDARRIWANLVACRDIVFEAIRPGASAAGVYRRFLAKFGELGISPISFVGHGIGQFLHEDPYLGEFGDATLEAGMVLGVEPLAYVPGRFGLQNKDMVAVTDQGCELLSDVVDTDQLFPIPA